MDANDKNDQWICVNKDCLYHDKHEDTFALQHILFDEPILDEWKCVKKDCLYHNHVVHYDEKIYAHKVIVNK